MSIAKKDPMVPEVYEKLSFKEETVDTFTMELQAVDRKNNKFKFLPGQFCMLHVFGVGESAISISGDPSKHDTIVHTVRNVGLVTKALKELPVGATLGVRGPFGTAWPVEEARGKDVVVMTGGIGLAPLRPMIYEILSNRKHYGKVSLLYGARTPSDILYAEEIKKWEKTNDMEVIVTVDKADSTWQGNVGVVTGLLQKTKIAKNNVIALICGPEIMIHYSVLELEKIGLQQKDIYVSMERNMQCGVGYCGHCMVGSKFICKNGPVLRYDNAEQLLKVREL